MNCKLCGLETKHLYTLNGGRTKTRIPVNFCKTCYVYFCEAIDYNYESADENIIEYYKNRESYIKSRQEKIFEFVQRAFCIKSGAFLDIGSGIGYSLKVAEDLGWQAVGLEPNAILEGYSKNVLKLDTVNGFLSEDVAEVLHSKLASGFADYILVDNVLEHIPKPVEFLTNALKLLKPSAVMLVAVPPVDWLRLAVVALPAVREKCASAQINLFYDPEQHVNYFSRRSMQILVEKVGGCKLVHHRFHHSKLLNSSIARVMQFETGYYFIIKN